LGNFSAERKEEERRQRDSEGTIETSPIPADKASGMGRQPALAPTATKRLIAALEEIATDLKNSRRSSSNRATGLLTRILPHQSYTHSLFQK